MCYKRRLRSTMPTDCKGVTVNSAQEQATKGLAKGEKHAPKAVEDFVEFPWEVALHNLADVPAGNYWVQSEDSRDTPDNEQGRHIEGAVRLFVQSHRYPLVDWVRHPSPRNGAPTDKPLSLIPT